MGIRYYAYAFDAEMTSQALADPRRFIRDDPLADAWGMPHGAQVATTNFEQSVSESDMLYLDKAWSRLQAMTEPGARWDPARPAYRMFEGQVTMHGYGWHAWVRALAPHEVPEIAEDLLALQREADRDLGEEGDDRYVRDFLDRAVAFVTGVAASNRGFAYLIG